MIAMMAEHKPVMLDQSMEFLRVHPGGIYVDCTTGLGGHSREIAAGLEGRGTLLAIDRDRQSLDMAREALQEYSGLISFHHENFKNLPLILRNLGIDLIDGCLVDLGVSRFQLTGADRGFSVREDGPLDMRMDREQRTSAAHLVNQLSLEELIRIFREYGEEPEAPRVARAIVEARRLSPIRTTFELGEIVAGAKKQRSRLNPATLVFQALRITVNQELEDLDRFLERAIQSLQVGARLVAISFHSLEDRIVKKTFQLQAGRCTCFQPGEMCRCPRIRHVEVLTRRPITATDAEVQDNISARSAKLRAVERVVPSSTR
jgi:16S rRNA (cytosine1402-N4)-methyltransferase